MVTATPLFKGMRMHVAMGGSGRWYYNMYKYLGHEMYSYITLEHEEYWAHTYWGKHTHTSKQTGNY